MIVPGRSSDADFIAWREQLQRVEDLGAVALVEHNLIVNGAVEPITVAEMTASGFRVARVPPLLGRTLVEADEVPGAPPVAVIGHSLWQRRFLGDPGIVGRSVRLGTRADDDRGRDAGGFGFPVAHQVWTPLRRQALRNAPDATALLVFGRLATGVTRQRGSGRTDDGRTADGGRRSRHTRSFSNREVVPYANLIVDPAKFERGLALANIFLSCSSSWFPRMWPC